MSDPLMKIIPGSQPARNLIRLADLQANVNNVRREFVGKPEVCHRLVSHIIHLRRGIDVDHHQKQFYRLLEIYLDVFLEHYDIRWLLSICDTVVDVGDPVQSACAMNIVTVINHIKIYHTILDIVVDGNLSTEKLRRNPGHKRPLGHGLNGIDIYQGDMLYNLMNRLNTVIARDAILNQIWCEIKRRLQDDPTVPINWLCSTHSNPEWRKFFK